MKDSSSPAMALVDAAGFEDDYTLDVRVVEASQPVAGLLLSTSDNCGNTCSGTACPSNMAYPA